MMWGFVRQSNWHQNSRWLGTNRTQDKMLSKSSEICNPPTISRREQSENTENEISHLVHCGDFLWTNITMLQESCLWLDPFWTYKKRFHNLRNLKRITSTQGWSRKHFPTPLLDHWNAWLFTWSFRGLQESGSTSYTNPRYTTDPFLSHTNHLQSCSQIDQYHFDIFFLSYLKEPETELDFLSPCWQRYRFSQQQTMQHFSVQMTNNDCALNLFYRS